MSLCSLWQFTRTDEPGTPWTVTGTGYDGFVFTGSLLSGQPSSASAASRWRGSKSSRPRSRRRGGVVPGDRLPVARPAPWKARRANADAASPRPVAKRTDSRYSAVKGQPRRYVSGHNPSGAARQARPPAPGAPACACGCGATVPLVTKTDLAKGVIRGEPRKYILGHARARRAEAARS